MVGGCCLISLLVILHDHPKPSVDPKKITPFLVTIRNLRSTLENLYLKATRTITQDGHEKPWHAIIDRSDVFEGNTCLAFAKGLIEALLCTATLAMHASRRKGLNCYVKALRRAKQGFNKTLQNLVTLRLLVRSIT